MIQKNNESNKYNQERLIKSYLIDQNLIELQTYPSVPLLLSNQVDQQDGTNTYLLFSEISLSQAWVPTSQSTIYVIDYNDDISYLNANDIISSTTYNVNSSQNIIAKLLLTWDVFSTGNITVTVPLAGSTNFSTYVPKLQVIWNRKIYVNKQRKFNINFQTYANQYSSNKNPCLTNYDFSQIFTNTQSSTTNCPRLTFTIDIYREKYQNQQQQ